MSNVNRTNIGRGVVAGFAATIVLSALMLMKQEMGLMPQGLAVRTGLSADHVKATIFGYPTAASDVGYML